jgi:hypothetical protein
MLSYASKVSRSNESEEMIKRFPILDAKATFHLLFASYIKAGATLSQLSIISSKILKEKGGI